MLPSQRLFDCVSFGCCPQLGMRWLQLATCISPFLSDSVIICLLSGADYPKTCFRNGRAGVAAIYLPPVTWKQKIDEHRRFSCALRILFGHLCNVHHFSSTSWGCSMNLYNTRRHTQKSDSLVSGS